MYERFTPDARSVVAGATEHARRLGHRYVGGEQLLLAIAGTGQPAGAVLSAHGVTPERLEEEIIRRLGTGAGATSPRLASWLGAGRHAAPGPA